MQRDTRANSASVASTATGWPVQHTDLTDGITPGRQDPVERVFRHNLWQDDLNLQFVVRRYLAWGGADRKLSKEEEQALDTAGSVIGGLVARNADVIDQNGPVLVKFNRMGEPINHIRHCPEALESRRALWGLAPGSFNGKLPIYDGVVHSAMRLMLGSVDSGLSCAMGVTGPMAYLVHKYMEGDVKEMLVRGLEEDVYDNALFGSIWLTEQSGGSDLGALETVAFLDDAGNWRIRGLKWFCSITDAKLIMTLARVAHLPKGIGNLALFIVPNVFPGSPQKVDAVHIRRLKSKLGLRSVPSGEVELRDAFAWPCGDPLDGKGINRIMEVVSPAQRNGVAAMGAGIARRAFIYAREYGSLRVAWGRPLLAHPSFRVQMLDMLSASEGCASLVMATQAQTDANGQPSLHPLVRILAPISKLRCCRQGVVQASLALETYGGNGYIGDWPLERLYRDAQNHPIWEGTEQVMAMDVLRALSRSDVSASLLGLFEQINARAKTFCPPALAVALRSLTSALAPHIAAIVSEKPKFRADALVFANLIADVIQLALLCDEAIYEREHESSLRKTLVAAWFAVSLPERRTKKLDAIKSPEAAIVYDNELFERTVHQQRIEMSSLSVVQQTVEALLSAPPSKL